MQELHVGCPKAITGEVADIAIKKTDIVSSTALFPKRPRSGTFNAILEVTFTTILGSEGTLQCLFKVKLPLSGIYKLLK